jgi:hypothetical protein
LCDRREARMMTGAHPQFVNEFARRFKPASTRPAFAGQT